MPLLPTPPTSHIPASSPVYPPSEDSYLFLDTLSLPSEIAFLSQRFPSLSSPSPLVLEVGTGSGIISAFVTANAFEVFGRSDVAVLAGDVNAVAAGVVRETVRGAMREKEELEKEKRNGSGTFLDIILSDLTTSLRLGSVDVLLFNPPYVPTEDVPDLPDNTVDATTTTRTAISEEARQRDDHLLSLSYAGGHLGMEVTNRLLSQLPTVLSQRGVAYVLFCARNDVVSVRARVEGWEGGDEKEGWKWRTEVVGKSGGKGGWERLEILRIWRG